MPRYFFDIEDGWRSKDSVGKPFESLPSARSHAIKLASEILRTQSESFNERQDWSFILRDEQGSAVFRLKVSGKDL